MITCPFIIIPKPKKKVTYSLQITSNLIFRSRNGFLILKNDENHMLHGYTLVKIKNAIIDFVKWRAVAAILDFFKWL